MKQFKTNNWLLRTAKSFTQGVLLLLPLLLLMPQAAHANDYLEQESHYSIYSTGADRIHFKIPVWAYGKSYDYYAYDASYIYYKLSGTTEWVPIASYYSDRYEENADNQNHGTAYVKLAQDMGAIVVTSMANGINHQLNSGDKTVSSGKLIVKQTKEYDCPQVTWLEFDWYPPESLNGKGFKVGIVSHFRRSYTQGNEMTTYVESSNTFSGNQNIITPQLMTPFLQFGKENGVIEGATAAIPYVLFNDPVNYKTSFDKNTVVQLYDRNGFLYVKTTDTIQPNFQAQFTMWVNKSISQKTEKYSNKVDILPYHRIYDFRAEEEMDSTGTYTGSNTLKWNIHNAELQDIVPGDVFEVQRAFQPDFSDAAQVAVLPLVTDSFQYSYTDYSRTTWSGNVDSIETDTLRRLSLTDNHLNLVDKDNNPLAELQATITAPVDITLSSVPVYYRIRRGTSSVWGWNNTEFAKTVTLKKRNFLAPLADVQEPYSVDTANHRVRFKIKIDNKDMSIEHPVKEHCTIKYKFIRSQKNAKLTISYPELDSEGAQVKVVGPDGHTIHDFKYLPAGTYEYPVGSKVSFTTRKIDRNGRDHQSYYTGTLSGDATLVFRCHYKKDVGLPVPEIIPTFNVEFDIVSHWEPIIKDSLYNQLVNSIPVYGKCMWDRTAHLVLMRHTKESSQTQEIIIPQDSIVRQEDGSWLAMFTDVADRACTHYEYSVRIDESNSDLHVRDSIELEPVTLTGPSIYYTEGAHIRKFTATQGDYATEMKQGVFLSWEPSDNNYDEFVLLRTKVGSSDSPDTIMIGTENSFMDRTAVPNQHYDYTIVAHFNCNGVANTHSADTEGWRTPYGEISGTIMMPDNTGIAGVTVTLESDKGETISQITTSTGAFKFDKLLYGDGTTYTITPTSAHAVFAFNNTGSPTATIRLTSDNAVASAIDFANTATTRITGRVLYKNTTIPVSGVMFLLNGDTVRRDNTPLTSGVDGNFEITVTKGQTYTLQVFKPGHAFEGNGILKVDDSTSFAIDKPLDGIRFYDETKVRLVGRVAGGNDQRDLKHGFGLGTNNLGDDPQLVLQIEGDNTARFVYDPNDLTRDTVQQQIEGTHTLFEKKRIIIQPDSRTGEYAVDLFPIRYKVIQATAKGYATLFASGQGSESFDLTNAPLQTISDTLNQQVVTYNAIYDRIYHSPMQVDLKQLIYGMTREALGEPILEVRNINPAVQNKVDLYTVQEDGTVDYLLGHPVYRAGFRYQFKAEAYEDYYYNSVLAGARDRVPLRGGSITIHNGLHNATESETFALDKNGINDAIWLKVDNIDNTNEENGALRTLSVSLEQEDNVVKTKDYQALVMGTTMHETDVRPLETDVAILDIIRDPGGSGSSAWVETGSTYNYSFTQGIVVKGGINLIFGLGTSYNTDAGVYAGAGGGTYTGTSVSSSQQYELPVPVVHGGDWGYQYTYSFSTNEKIATSSAASSKGVGAMADVFYGTTISQLATIARGMLMIDDSLYQMRQPAMAKGTMKVIAQGVKDGKKYYLVTDEQILLGTRMNNTFAYTQHHIINTLLPEILLERYNLLMNFNDSLEAQAAADASGEPVYWLKQYPKTELDTLTPTQYSMVIPQNSKTVYIDRVKALDRIFLQWLKILYNNEQEKVAGRYNGTQVGTYSVSNGASLTHNESYSAVLGYNVVPQNWSAASDGANVLSQTGTAFLKGLSQAGKALLTGDHTLDIVTKTAKAIIEGWRSDSSAAVNNIQAATPGYKFSFKLEPVIDLNVSARRTSTLTNSKSTGFTIGADPNGDITVSCVRVPYKAWSDSMKLIINQAEAPAEQAYGSYVFYTQGGATLCPHEGEEKTQFYNPGTTLSNGTMWIVKPEISADNYEVTNVQPENRAVFRVKMMNNSDMDAGPGAGSASFNLSLDGSTNPNGAKVYVNGAPLAQPISYSITPGQPIYQTIEIERGQVDDYENLTFVLASADCGSNKAKMNLSVHFLPKSSDVNIASPKQNWVMNTLSPHDSVGYYLPIDINGFDIYHKNFDHIEFQYKLATESEDMWVNQCSFYADDSLYNLATGNKAMIENGTITPFRFYGERDPMEQKYDLRAVAYCRYGSGFVTASSPVISGTKDTRPPRVFGQPEPANAILGVGDNLKLRYNEPIAGNYLDEDANFSIIGLTNRMGITATTSIGFDGSDNSYAESKASRNLSNRSFSVDMIVKPASPNTAAVFFQHGDGWEFGLTTDNRLYATIDNQTYLSQPVEPILAFTRVAMVYDNDNQTLRFYVGTQDVSDEAAVNLPVMFIYNKTANFIFGKGLRGNMLEARVWTKALSAAQIAETNFKYLTGYERDLLAYYRMNEGYGSTLNDKANGATLYCSGHTWTLPDGISLRLNGEQLQLNGNLLGRNDIQDETLIFWFKTTVQDGTLFSAGNNTFVTIKSGMLTFRSGDKEWTIGSVADDNWHQIIIPISRTYNVASIYLDGNLTQSISATDIQPIAGIMFLGGDGFVGHIDEFAIFEQALPANLCKQFRSVSIQGDEMGLMAYLPFEQTKLSSFGILELVFSINDQRIFKDANGQIVEKQIPLIVSDIPDPSKYADKAVYAPVSDHDKLTKLNFDWAFNGDELLINLKMLDKEINKQSIYVTVRDVEDLNGNPMVSPVTWTAFVDYNALKWNDRKISVTYPYGSTVVSLYDMDFTNLSGKRHQYTIESLEDWLTVDAPYGSMQPMDEKTVQLAFNTDMAVGTYDDIIYLTDEEGLSEPLYVTMTIEATPPYEPLDESKYPNNMSICAQVKLITEHGVIYDTDPNDIVYALCDNECVGMEKVSFNEITHTSKVFLTVFGTDSMNHKPIHFQLWQASTGKIYDMTASRNVLFSNNHQYGCDDTIPLILSTIGCETQDIELTAGWNWVSVLLCLHDTMTTYMTVSTPWMGGDVIKSPGERIFAEYSAKENKFIGKLNKLHYSKMYMVNVASDKTLRVSGERLPEDSMQITVRGNGQWSVLPCLFENTTPLTQALTDYYDHATPGDMIKAHNRFAIFTSDRKWEGNLTALNPGEGYMFRRKDAGSVTISFYPSIKNANVAPRKVSSITDEAYTNPNAATNMTMIAQVEKETNLSDIHVYVGGELAAVCAPITIGKESYFFLTIQSDQVGELCFEMGDKTLEVSPANAQAPVRYAADAHAGSVEKPIMLRVKDNLPYKIIEKDHVVIIRNNKKYDVTGQNL